MSLLGSLHPDGATPTALVLGQACPLSLRPQAGAAPAERASLIVLAPSVAECRKPGWLEEAVQRLAGSLAADGLGYVLVPPRWRAAVSRQLRRVGLVPDTPIAHLPDWHESVIAVPLTTPAVNYVLGALTSTPRWMKELGPAWLRLPGGSQLLGLIWASAALIARHPGARPLGEWLFSHDPDLARTGSVIIRTGWRGRSGTLLLYAFERGAQRPTLVAKVRPESTPSGRCIQEAEALASAGYGAQQAGARVPVLLGLDENHGRPALIQSALGGQPADEVLRHQPERLEAVITGLVAWLERWHRATAAMRVLDGRQLRQHVLEPADRLVPLLKCGSDYRDWLKARCYSLVGASLPYVATHNDLTMTNVLLTCHGELGIVDWEAARREGWPLMDFYYAVADASLIARRAAGRSQACQACFTPHGHWAEAVMCWRSRLQAAVGLSDELAELCLHACWLHHAVNEMHDPHALAGRPFLEVMQWLAQRTPEGETLGA